MCFKKKPTVPEGAIPAIKKSSPEYYYAGKIDNFGNTQPWRDNESTSASGSYDYRNYNSYYCSKAFKKGEIKLEEGLQFHVSGYMTLTTTSKNEAQNKEQMARHLKRFEDHIRTSILGELKWRWKSVDYNPDDIKISIYISTKCQEPWYNRASEIFE